MTARADKTQRTRWTHVEGGLGKSVVLAGKDLAEGLDGLLKGDELSLDTSEDLSDSEGLGRRRWEVWGSALDPGPQDHLDTQLNP